MSENFSCLFVFISFLSHHLLSINLELFLPRFLQLLIKEQTPVAFNQGLKDPFFFILEGPQDFLVFL